MIFHWVIETVCQRLKPKKWKNYIRLIRNMFAGLFRNYLAVKNFPNGVKLWIHGTINGVSIWLLYDKKISAMENGIRNYEISRREFAADFSE